MDHNDSVAFLGGTIWVTRYRSMRTMGRTGELKETQIPNGLITITPVLFTCKHRPGISVAHMLPVWSHRVLVDRRNLQA